MGTNTDPYQRAEAKFKLTRGIIKTLVDAGTPFSILTKSPLVTRDLDLIAPAAQQLDVQVHFSIATVDEHVWRISEPGTPHPRRRLEAMRAMIDAGVPTGALMAPILPGLSDRRDQITATVEAIQGTGAHIMHAHPVYLRGATKEHFMAWLHEHDPELHARYEKGLDAAGQVSREYKIWVREAVASATR
jgi:DNA repair photolyase